MKKGKQNIVYIDLTQDAESLKNCSICTNDLPASEFVKCTAKCQHEFCKKCIKHYLEAEINSKMYKEEINCLYGITRCPHKMGFEEITQLAAKKDSNRYETLLLRRTLQNIKGFTWCSNSTCGSGQIHDGGLLEGDKFQYSIMTCDACHSKTYVSHKVPFHFGKTCEDYDSENIHEAAANLHYFMRETKNCPKCGVRLEKSGGCDHFTCAHCTHEFCWRCMAAFAPIRDEGNHRHEKTCSFYAAYEPDSEEEM